MDAIMYSILPSEEFFSGYGLLTSEFDVHSSILGSSSSRDISTIITYLADTENYLTGLSISA